MRKLILTTLAMSLFRWLTKPKARAKPAPAPRQPAAARTRGRQSNR